MTEKRYDVIYEKEPRGQVVTDNGIPCTARTCVTRLNRLTEENEQLKTQLSEQGTQIDFLKDENKHMRKLVNENVQLKKENKNLKRGLINIINSKIKEREEDLEKAVKAGMPTGLMYSEIELLEELKQELEE